MGETTESNSVTGCVWVREPERQRELNYYKLTQLGLLLSHTTTPHCRHAEDGRFLSFCLHYSGAHFYVDGYIHSEGWSSCSVFYFKSYSFLNLLSLVHNHKNM